MRSPQRHSSTYQTYPGVNSSPQPSPKGNQGPPYRSSLTDQQKLPDAVRATFLRKPNDFEQNNNPMRNLNFIMRNPILSTKCQLCEESFQRGEMDSLGNCTHVFCHNCLNTYCVYKINTMEDVICPKEDCSAEINEQGGVFQGLPQQSKDKYRKTQLWKQTISNPNLRLCPTQDCEGVINTADGNFQCPKCRVRFCKECQLPQHEGPCDTNFQQNFKDWKRCPRCHVFIERTEGCNHMTCRCTHEFCYVCLANWDEQHYNCQNNPFLITERWVEEMPRWKQILLGLAMVLLFPIALAVFIVVFVLGVVIATVIGFFCGPMAMMGNQVCQNCLVCLFLCPLLMVAGAIFAFFSALFFGAIMLCSAIGGYMKMVGSALCGSEAQINNGQTVFDN